MHYERCTCEQIKYIQYILNIISNFVLNKRYFMIDQQIALKGCDSSQSGNPYSC